MNAFYPIGQVGNLPGGFLPVGNAGALRRGDLRRSNRRAEREMEDAMEINAMIAKQQRQQQQFMAAAAAQQAGIAQAYNVGQNPGVMPIQSPYAANVPGGNPFAPQPASPPVTPPANARPVPLGATSASQMAAISGNTPGTATLTFTSQDPFWLFDMYLQLETANLAYIESITLGSQSIRAGNGGVIGVDYFSVGNFNQGKLQGYFINSTQSLVVVVRNLSNATNWCLGACSGASVR